MQRPGWPPPRPLVLLVGGVSITLLLRRAGLERAQPVWRARGRRAGGDHPRADAPRRLAGHRQRVARAGRGRAASARVDVEPNSGCSWSAHDRVHRMALDRGTIHARIWAPPKLFVVNTAAATAIDLGCAYTLQMDERRRHAAGDERLGRPRAATVATAYIPEGAVCAIRTERGPGTPRYEDAPSGYGEALMILDFAPSSDPRRAGALDLVLSQRAPARCADAVAPVDAWLARGARPRLRSARRAGAAARRGHPRADPRRRPVRARQMVGLARNRSLDLVAVVQKEVVMSVP